MNNSVLNNSIKCLFVWLFISLLIFSSGCSNSDVAGTGSQAGNGIVTAVVVYDDSTVASNAEVYVRQSDYLKDTSNNSIEEYVSLVDNYGRVNLELDTETDFVIEIRDNNGYALLAVCSTNAYVGDSLNFDTLYLEKDAVFFGEVDISNLPKDVPVYVQVYGMNKIEKVDSLGYFKFDHMPHGKYSLKIVPGHTDYLPVDSQNIALGPEDSLEAGKFLLPQDFWKDTVIIREILDLNGLNSTSVDSVVKRDPFGRIRDLLLFGKNIDTLPPSIGDLGLHVLLLAENNLTDIPGELGRMQSLEHLDLAKNSISILPLGFTELRNLRYLDLNENSLSSLPPDFGKLRFLNHFKCRQNQLHELPGSIGMIEHLENLDLYDNVLDKLPFEILNITTLQLLDLQYNRLKNQPTLIKQWINEYSNNSAWEITQKD